MMNNLKRFTKTFLCAAGLLAAAFVAGCGGGHGRDPILGIPPAALVSITVTPAAPSIPVCCIQQFIATANYADGTARIVTNESNWTSGTPAVATVDPGTGLARSLTPGTALITAAFGGISGSATLTVTALPIKLGGATYFAILAGTSLTNNANGTTLLRGDVGSPSQTNYPAQSEGTNYQFGPQMAAAFAGLQTAIADANGRACTFSPAGPIDLGGKTLTPGVHCFDGPVSITGNVTLSGAGLYVFRTNSSIDTAPGSSVSLANGAAADTVFWVPGGATTLGANSAFKGSILAQDAITFGDNATLVTGRALSATKVTLSNNKISI